jgi:hypothetical protein
LDPSRLVVDTFNASICRGAGVQDAVTQAYKLLTDHLLDTPWHVIATQALLDAVKSTLKERSALDCESTLDIVKGFCIASSVNAIFQRRLQQGVDRAEAISATQQWIAQRSKGRKT